MEAIIRQDHLLLKADIFCLMVIGQRERNSLQRQICGTSIVREIKDLSAFPSPDMSH